MFSLVRATRAPTARGLQLASGAPRAMRQYSNGLDFDPFTEVEGQNQASQSKGRNPMFATYRPNNDPALGSALQFHYDSYRKSVYVHAAKQKGPKLPPGASGHQFDWEKKVVAKISTYEMGQFVRELNRPSEKGFDIIHKFPTPDKTSGTTGLRLRQGKPGTWNLNVVPEGEKRVINLYFDEVDAIVLGVFFKESIVRSLGFE